MDSQSFTPISEIGEFNLIKKITKGVFLGQKETKFGVGDDCSVLSFVKGTDHLMSADMLVEGVHFDSSYTPIKHLGYKAVAVNISDVCAMNGLPSHVLVSIGIPNKYSVELIEQLYEGVRLACKNYNVDLIGGDTTASSGGLVISVTVLGKTKSTQTTYRGGAKPNHLLVVSGSLGGSYLGLQILEREKMIFEQNMKSQPNLDEYREVLERQLKPEPRTDLVKKFKEINMVPSSMIDISDGLCSESTHLATASNVGIKIYSDKIPISKETRVVAEELNLDPVFCALHGGEDYELLFTVPLNQHSLVQSIGGISIIGCVTESPKKVELVKEGGVVVDLTNQGWSPFSKDKHI